ncbi:amidase [Carnobacterium gallinarum]|uniref:amidase n=1 Tax=Carnobacterium gallinarum TaxID=2749 RepID=UPI0005581197|nr:amidase [Carnobacterium gallinarum]
MMDGLDFVTKLATNELSAVELIEDAFAKIEKHNPLLNAVVHTRKEAALKEASTRNLQDTPFKGLPFLTKGLGQELVNEPSNGASRLFDGQLANKTSHYVQALEKAGFIIIGQTNAPEFGFKNITDPQLHGPSRNSWNPDYSPGGSSGGAASSVSSGMVPIAGASDGGGSIRIPAAFSGLIGLKPTRGRTPVGPGSGRNWQGAAIDFALTTSMRDTAAMLDVLQVIEPAAAFQVPLFKTGYLNTLNQKIEKPFRIAYSLESPVGTPVSQEAKDAVLAAVHFLEEQHFNVIEQQNPINGLDLMKSYYVMNAGETAAMFANTEKNLQRSLTKQDMELMTWALFTTGKSISAAEYSNSLALWDHAAEEMAQFNETYDLYLTPTTADTAPRIDAQLQTTEQLSQLERIDELTTNEQQQTIYDMFEKSLAITPFTQQANLTGQPSISLPTHLAKNGLPLGIQFTAPKGKEDWLLQMGVLFEKHNKFIHKK